MWQEQNKITCPKQGMIKYELDNFMEHGVGIQRRGKKKKNISSVVELV